MISHERLDRLVGQILPARTGALDRRCRQPTHRRELRRRRVHDRVRARRVRPHPRTERRHGAAGRRPRPVPSPPPVRAVRQRWARPNRPCWCTAAGCRWRSTPTAASIPLPRCAIRVSTPGWSWSGRARCGRGSNGKPQDCPSTSPATSAAATPSRRSWRPPTSRSRPARTRRSGWRRWRRSLAAPRPWCREPRRWPRSSPPTAGPPPTTTRTPSRAPSRRSSADRNACAATAHDDAPNSSPGHGRPQACSTRWARVWHG